MKSQNAEKIEAQEAPSMKLVACVDLKQSQKEIVAQEKDLEEALVAAIKKEMLAKQIYDERKEDVKTLKEQLSELLEKRHNEEKMPLLRAMIQGEV